MTLELEQWPGRAYPLGATYDGAGTNFSLFSEVAERVELCLFDDEDREARWFDWKLVETNAALLDFTRRLIEFRKRHPVFRRRRWFQGRPIRGIVDIGWFRPDGSEMTEEDWASGFAKSIAVLLNGEAIPTPDPEGRRILDDSFLLFFNAHSESLKFTLPERLGGGWHCVLDTFRGGFIEDSPALAARQQLEVGARAVVVFTNAPPPT